jgi:hypothetical protein
MFKILFVTLLVGSTLSIQAQKDYFQQKVDYTIEARLNAPQKAIHGQLTLDYTNQSPDTLGFLWFHIWANAYSGDNTALSKQIENDKELRKTLKKADKGFMDSLDFSAKGKKLKTEPHPVHPDIIKVMLQEPLMPGKSVQLQTPFYNRLPTYYSRSGEFDGQFIATQWYPKPAVYDKDGWHEMPYLDMGEFYAEFGDYKVSITVPGEMIVGASGVLQNKDELDKYKQAGLANNNKANPKDATAVTWNNSSPKTLNYTAENVHDFAWFAQPGFLVQYDTCQLASGKIIDVFAYYRKDSRKDWVKSIEHLKAGTRFYSSEFGDYPHPQVSAVEGPKNVNSGGMEYPMITLITVPEKNIEEQLEITIVHEVGHNWLQGILGTNERSYPWFDEGFNTFFQFKYESQQKKNSILGKSIPNDVRQLPADEFFGLIMQSMAQIPFKYAVDTHSADFDNKESYGITAYIKGAIWLFILESRMGQDKFSAGIKEYYNTWKFKHPSPMDFKKVMEDAAGFPLDDVFELLKKEGGFLK